MQNNIFLKKNYIILFSLIDLLIQKGFKLTSIIFMLNWFHKKSIEINNRVVQELQQAFIFQESV